MLLQLYFQQRLLQKYVPLQQPLLFHLLRKSMYEFQDLLSYKWELLFQPIHCSYVLLQERFPELPYDHILNNVSLQ